METKDSFWLLIIFLLYPAILFSQNEDCRGYSGDTNPQLINGKLYTFFPAGTVKGDQFLRGEEFTEGSLTIRGKTYSGRRLNYDIYNQQLLMLFERHTGAEAIMVVSEAWLTGFRMLNKDFILRDQDSLLPGIYQVIGEGDTKILLHWEKRMLLRDVTGTAYYQFSSPDRKMYLAENGEFKSFRNRRTLLKLMGPEKRGKMRKFLRSEKIRVKKAEDAQMNRVIEFYQSLLH